MIKIKKLSTASLLLFVYALLMLQETVLCQVLCYKENGAVHLEMAIFSFRCSCSKNCGEHESDTSCQRSGLTCKPVICVDQPLNTAWLERDINPNSSKTGFIGQANPTGQINAQPGCFSTQLSESGFLITRAKFLPNLSNPNYSMSMRC